jgi:hypothetical protein
MRRRLPSLFAPRPKLLLATTAAAAFVTQRDHVGVRPKIRFRFVSSSLLPAEDIRSAIAGDVRLASPPTRTAPAAAAATEDFTPTGMIPKGRIEFGTEQSR